MTYAEEIAQAIEAWLEEKNSRNISMLARLAGISYSSARRAIQKECEPSQQTVLKIASIVFSRPQYLNFCGKYFKNLQHYVAEVNYPANQSEVLQRYMSSEKHFVILVLASSIDGTTEEEVTKTFGCNYQEYLHDLIESACLTRSSDGRWVLNEDFGSPSFELARKMLSSFLAVHDRKCDDIKSASSSWVGWESLTPPVAREVVTLLAECSAKVANLISNPENRGNVLVCTGLYSGILKGREEL